MTPPDTARRALHVLALVAVVALAAGPAAAQSAAEPAFVVQLEADGSATVTLQSTFDLTTDAEREAFASLETDDQAQDEAAARFLERLRAVAGDAEAATGREMRVTEASIELRRTDDGRTGVVTLTATWTGLAATDGDRLVVTEPFASGFAPERPFVVRAPDGYVVEAASPAPDARDETSATWQAGSDLAGLTVEVAPAPTPTAEPTETGGQPGFGALAALAALLAVAVLARRAAR